MEEHAHFAAKSQKQQFIFCYIVMFLGLSGQRSLIGGEYIGFARHVFVMCERFSSKFSNVKKGVWENLFLCYSLVHLAGKKSSGFQK